MHSYDRNGVQANDLDARRGGAGNADHLQVLRNKAAGPFILWTPERLFASRFRTQKWCDHCEWRGHWRGWN